MVRMTTADALAVLVVDDDDDARELMGSILELHGFAVETAASAEACLAILSTERPRVSVVLTDVEMPGMGGIELCQTLRRQYPDLVLVVMSGLAEAIIGARARASGATAFLRKPVDIAALERVLRQLPRAVTAGS